MKQPGLDRRHRDRDGQIDRKRGDTLVRTLREEYPGFAPGWSENAKLQQVRDATGKTLSQLLQKPR